MKRALLRFFEVLLAVIIGLPILLIIFIAALIYLPFDYVKYKMSAYYKGTKCAYTFLFGLSACFKLYNLICEHNLPIKYVQIDRFGYFYYKDVLLLYDYTGIFYDGEKNELVVSENDEEVKLSESVKEKMTQFIKESGISVIRAVVLTDKTELYDADIEDKDMLLFYNDGENDLAGALKKFINDMEIKS